MRRGHSPRFFDLRLQAGGETANTYGIGVPGCNPLTREHFSDQVDDSGGECQSLLPLLPVERLIRQASRDPVWIAGGDVIEVKGPCPRDGIEGIIE
mgnify:FL=1